MARLKIYYWNEEQNFGDALNPVLIEKLFGIKTEWADLRSAALVGAGSCLQWVAKEISDYPHEIHIWGTGYMFDKDPAVASPLVKHHAVRGKKSQEYGKLDDITLGDPGILASLLVDKPVEKQHPVGIVPHLWNKEDQELHLVKERYPSVKIIDVRDSPMEVIKQIAACDFIYSSSLHGLIVADSFGVPNQWVEFTDKLFGDKWKFHDYYSVYNITTPSRIAFSQSLLLKDKIQERADTFVIRQEVSAIQNSLLDAFPKDIIFK